MNRIRGKLSVGVLVLAAIGVVGVFTAPLASASCGGIETAIISCDDGANPTLEIVKLILKIMIGLVGIAAVGALIFAGILYSSASGEQAQVQKAKTMIQNTVIGILLFGTMMLLGNFLIPGGVFGGDIVYNGSGKDNGSGVGNTGGGGNNGGSGNGGSVKVATFNIRTTKGDAWSSERSNAILNYMKSVDIVGIQEGTTESINWLTPKMKAAGYSSAAYKTGEYRAIFWKTSKVTALKQGVKSLPDGRNLVWANFKLTSTGSEFYFLNTHLKVWGTSPSKWSTTTTSPYRIGEIKEILSFVKSSVPTSSPTVFVGDVNSYPGSAEDKLIQSGGFKDSYVIASTKKNLNYRSSSKPIMGTAEKGSKGQIDRIYSMRGVSVSRLEVMINAKGSDHVPVEADITLPGSSNGSPSSANAPPTLSSKIGNFRDAGGSGYIKTGVIYRSANLNNATTADKKKLATLLKGGKLIDLRLSSDSGYEADPSLTGVANVHIAIKGEASASGYKKTFIKDSTARAQFGKAFTEIANATGPVQIHCKAGKDRTGWLIALAMMATGVSKDNARTEYLLSPDVDKDWFNAAYSEATNKAHTGGSGKIIDFITRSVADGGLGVSQSTVNTLKTRLGK